jgi:hypothetical protein
VTCPVVMVTNDVSGGIVPENAMARVFRSAQGRLNQRLAAHADLVVFVTAGLPQILKGSNRRSDRAAGRDEADDDLDGRAGTVGAAVLVARLWWVRHGPTHQTTFTGWRDVPADLSDGAALDRLDAYLPAHAVLVSSDLLRASATADRISAGGPASPTGRNSGSSISARGTG